METKLKEMINSFNSSSEYINELSNNLQSFTDILENVKNELEPLRDLKNYLKDSNVFKNLENIASQTKIVSEKIESNMGNVDKYIATVDNISENYSNNIEITLQKLKALESLINNYNKEVSPYIKEIHNDFGKISGLDLAGITSEFGNKISGMYSSISKYTDNIKDGIKQVDLTSINFKKENNDNYLKISSNFEEALVEQNLYSDQLKKLLAIHQDLNVSVETMKEKGFIN